MLIEQQTAHLRGSLVPNRELELPAADHSSAGNGSHEQQNFALTGNSVALPHQDALNGMMDLDTFDTSALGADADAWMTLPYDYGMAPFNTETEAMSFGFEMDSLDFLWALGA